MFTTIARGWQLMQQSWHVLRLDKELLLFPVFSTVACFALMASLVVPIVVSPTIRENAHFFIQPDDPHQGVNQGGLPFRKLSVKHLVPAAVAFLFYLTTTFVIVFFNTALACCVIERFSGGDPTLGDGLQAAIDRLPQILGWALLSATVGTILKQVEERVPFVGQIVLRFVGMAWALVTYLIVPILASERIGPMEAVQRSAGLIRKTWGETLVGQVSLAGIQFLFYLGALVGMAVSFGLAIHFETLIPIAVGSGIVVAYVIVVTIVFSTLQQIFLAAVYQYAAIGSVPVGFSQDLIESAFRPKRTR
ncbi:MAG: DUF6159 family protein [Planctomycetota bacterium]